MSSRQSVKYYAGLPVLLALLLAPGAVAQQVGDKMQVAFKGHLMPAITACQVNKDQTITAEFNNVGINKVASGQYILPLKYSLEKCDGAANTIKMMLKATANGLDAATMSTSVAGLGVKVLKDGQPLALNQYFTIADGQKPPQLQVQLVKDPAITLKESAFTATGTLLAEYQ